MSYQINRTVDPPICLPASVDVSKLTDITPKGAAWRIYLDPKTGKRYDGSVYYKNVGGPNR